MRGSRKLASRLRARSGARESRVVDRRTGYYVAGHDWPAISSELSVSDLYLALEEIGDADVLAATGSLKTQASSGAKDLGGQEDSSG